MHNIPPLNRTHPAITRLNRRANRIAHGENAKKSHSTLSKLDRRKHHERRKSQVTISVERRKYRNIRRKSDYLAQNAEHFSSLSDTVGTHINTEV